ncbi:uncharacterized protein FIBRA_08196 [Fibroporia radiculosa]|uniref:Uncharacterized protein n=1 Tax=Fibroporia radiculosa TaxID=599839 RepID=J4I2C6_9APHY|nr:uncharacterized protein FIBRA_08196 [Fibroporia radiculosa]CCM05957.1 predicted protein [Fibroporia radiculosa]
MDCLVCEVPAVQTHAARRSPLHSQGSPRKLSLKIDAAENMRLKQVLSPVRTLRLLRVMALTSHLPTPELHNIFFTWLWLEEFHLYSWDRFILNGGPLQVLLELASASSIRLRPAFVCVFAE